MLSAMSTSVRSGPFALRYAARSDRGLVRGGNQDSVYAGPRLLAVADGMGGMAAGDLASQLVIDTIAPLDEDVPGSAMIDILSQAVEAANQRIRDAVDADPTLEGMGTTLTALLFSGSKLGLAHIGDSRAYLLRDGELTQVTRDDTYVQKLVDSGAITAAEAGTHPLRSRVLQVIQGREIEPLYSVREAVAGDRYLLCSDGLSAVVDAATLAATLREYTDPRQCADHLVDLALMGGGPDNVSVIVADVTDEDLVEEAPIVGGAAPADTGTAPAGAADRRPRWRRRIALALAALLAVLGVAGWFAWTDAQSRYYIGATGDGTVAVFRGVPGLPWAARVSERSATKLSDLTPTAQDAVKSGILADSEADARRKLAELTRDTPDNPNRVQPTPTPS